MKDVALMLVVVLVLDLVGTIGQSDGEGEKHCGFSQLLEYYSTLLLKATTKHKEKANVEVELDGVSYFRCSIGCKGGYLPSALVWLAPALQTNGLIWIPCVHLSVLWQIRGRTFLFLSLQRVAASPSDMVSIGGGQSPRVAIILTCMLARHTWRFLRACVWVSFVY